MDKLRNYDIVFSGLKDGKHAFQFEIKQTFFEIFEAEQEFENPRIVADVMLEKHSTFLEFEVKIYGVVALSCDISGEIFDHELANQVKVLVKFGAEYDDSNEEVITIPADEHTFNIAQLVYETIVLAIPMKKLSPNLSDKDLDILKQFSPEYEEDQRQNQDIDPRWEALKKLKKDK